MVSTRETAHYRELFDANASFKRFPSILEIHKFMYIKLNAKEGTAGYTVYKQSSAYVDLKR